MPIRFRLQYDNGIVTTGYISAIFLLAMLQSCRPIIIRCSQKAIFTIRLSNATINSTDSYKTIPFNDCLCPIVSISQCLDNEFLRECRVISLLLFVLLAYFISKTLIISGDGAYIFVHLYWTFCFICFFTILIVLYWRNYYYNEMTIVLIVTGFLPYYLYIPFYV